MTKEKVYKKRTSSIFFWDPEQDPEIEGKLKAIRQSKYNRDIYDIETEAGLITVPSSVVLEGLITKLDLDKKIKIKFLGWKQGKAGKFRAFEVYDMEGE